VKKARFNLLRVLSRTACRSLPVFNSSDSPAALDAGIDITPTTNGAPAELKSQNTDSTGVFDLPCQKSPVVSCSGCSPCNKRNTLEAAGQLAV
jgi:hypothetical protein